MRWPTHIELDAASKRPGDDAARPDGAGLQQSGAGHAGSSRKLQVHRLRATRLSVVNSALQSMVMGLFAWNGEVPWPVVAAFALATVGSTSLFALAIRLGWNLRWKDPDILHAQIYTNSLIQLAFFVAAPKLWFVFLVALSVTYIFALFSFEPRQFTRTWLALGAGMAVAFLLVGDRFEHVGTSVPDRLLLWLFAFLCMRQLMMFGKQFSDMRMKLSERNKALAASLARLEALAVEQRLVERERSARELHDTLLQGVQGLMLHLQAATECIPPHEPARRMMENALERADEILLHGRDKLLQLRVAGSAGHDLPEALATAGEELSADSGVDFRFVLCGNRREIQSVVAEEVYRVGREALVNAFQHAHATTICVTLNVGEADLRLQVVDDGIGLPCAELPSVKERCDGGMVVMRERARRIGAELTLHSAPGRGSEVRLVIAAALAYR